MTGRTPFTRGYAAVIKVISESVISKIASCEATGAAWNFPLITDLLITDYYLSTSHLPPPQSLGAREH
jgi:hypothetical protein